MGAPASDTLTVTPSKRARCHYCGEPGRKRNLTKDHVIPKSRGGRSHWSNYVWACATCNSTKGSALPTCRCDHCIIAVQAHLRYIRSFVPSFQVGLLDKIEGLDPYYESRKVLIR